jgi:hypothetical protein
MLKYLHPFFQKERKTGASSIMGKPLFFSISNVVSTSSTSKAM